MILQKPRHSYFDKIKEILNNPYFKTVIALAILIPVVYFIYTVFNKDKINCRVSDWKKGECNCDNGTIINTRTIITNPLNGGLACPELSNIEDCSKYCREKTPSPTTLAPTTAPTTVAPTTAPTTVAPTTAPTTTTSPTTLAPTTSPTTLAPTTAPTTVAPTTAPTTVAPTTAPTTTTSPTTLAPTTSPTTLAPTIPPCIVSDWTKSGICGPCGVQSPIGKQLQTRAILNTGKDCPELTRYVECECPIININPLPTTLPPVNCVVNDWSSWSTCSANCGGGTQTRTRNVITPAQNGGNSCPVLSETQPCNTEQCVIQSPPVNCLVGDWSSWSMCSANCGGGTQTRRRNIITPAQNGGNSCPVLSETQPCNTQQCATPEKQINCCKNYCNTNVDISRYPPPQGINMYNFCINNCIANPSDYSCNI
jgi:hypothetical protein